MERRKHHEHDVLIFEYKGPVAVTQRARVHGELTHKRAT